MLKKKQKEKPAESEVERVRHSLFTDTCSAQTTIWDICPMIIHDYIFRLGLDKGADATIVIFEGTCIRGGGKCLTFQTARSRVSSASRH